MATSKQFKLSNVILSFPNLYSKEKYQGEETANWSAVLMFEKSRKDLFEAIREAGDAAVAEEFGKKAPKKIWETDKRALKDGDDYDDNDEGVNAYEGLYTLKSSNKKRILTLDRSLDQVALDDGDDEYNGIFYPGCKVDVIVSMWTAASYPHVRSNLHIVQFRADGERLGGNGPNVSGMMEMLDEIDDEDEDVDI